MSNDCSIPLSEDVWEVLASPYLRRHDGEGQMLLMVAELGLPHVTVFRYQMETITSRLQSLVKYNRSKEILREIRGELHQLRVQEPVADLLYLSNHRSEYGASTLARLVGVEPVVRRMAGYSLRLPEDSAPVDFTVSLVVEGAPAKATVNMAGVLADVLRTESVPTPALESALRTGAHLGVTSDAVKGVYFDLQLRGLLGSPVEDLTYRLVLDGMDRRQAYRTAEALLARSA